MDVGSPKFLTIGDLWLNVAEDVAAIRLIHNDEENQYAFHFCLRDGTVIQTISENKEVWEEQKKYLRTNIKACPTTFTNFQHLSRADLMAKQEVPQPSEQQPEGTEPTPTE